MLVNYDSKYNQFTSNYDSRVVIYERKMYIRLATDQFAPLDKSTLGIDRTLYSRKDLQYLIRPISDLFVSNKQSDQKEVARCLQKVAQK